MESEKLHKLIDWARQNGTIINQAIEFKVHKSNGIYATLADPDKINDLNGVNNIDRFVIHSSNVVKIN